MIGISNSAAMSGAKNAVTAAPHMSVIAAIPPPETPGLLVLTTEGTIAAVFWTN
jgi:hypothetical protein